MRKHLHRFRAVDFPFSSVVLFKKPPMCLGSRAGFLERGITGKNGNGRHPGMLPCPKDRSTEMAFLGPGGDPDCELDPRQRSDVALARFTM